jgi:hypothetical protein
MEINSFVKEPAGGMTGLFDIPETLDPRPDTLALWI